MEKVQAIIILGNFVFFSDFSVLIASVIASPENDYGTHLSRKAHLPAGYPGLVPLL